MKAIRAVAMDVDGVLTDNTFAWREDGQESKSFSFRDVMGVSLARKAGFRFALISGESTPFVDMIAHKLGITDIHKGCKDKATALRAFAEQHQLALAEICFIGDDVNDVPAMLLAGLSAAPADAHTAAKRAAALITQAPGGRGAVREVLDRLLATEAL